MKEFKVKITSIDDVKNFVGAACSQMCEIDIISGKYVIDAKSIMGIFSLDLSKPVTVRVNGTDEESDAFKALVSGCVAED